MKRPNLKLKKPNLDLKLPSLGAGRFSGPKVDVKAPKFAADLYADLRDRRLLPLVALLLVAIAAVPFLLGGGEEEEESAFVPGPASARGGPAEAASFAVVPSDPGLRNFRDRLGHRQARNPFNQPTAKASGGGGGGEATGGGGGGGEIQVEGGSGSVPSTGGGSSTSTTTTTTDVVVKSTVVGHALRARAGFLGDLKQQPRIVPMTTLPSEKNPVLVFVGLSKDEKGAIFLMTSDVTAYHGKARCVLDEQIRLHDGGTAPRQVGHLHLRLRRDPLQVHPAGDLPAGRDQRGRRFGDRKGRIRSRGLTTGRPSRRPPLQ